MPRTLTLTKHHGAGNDFLVLIDDARRWEGELARLAEALCDRRRGIGADGLVAAFPDGDADAVMVLHNADGSRAEMSGNGIRCLAQALVDRGWAAGARRLRVRTDAGLRELEVEVETEPGARRVSVSMPPVRVLALGEGRADVDTGNPHLVLLVDDLAGVDLVALGARHPDRNVEVVRVDDSTTVTMRVHERGVGITEACGTGSTAAAGATRAWGLTGDRVVVRNPGGDLEVLLGAEGGATLIGPTRFVGRIEVPWP